MLRVSWNQNQGVARAAVLFWILGSFSKFTSCWQSCDSRIKVPIFLLAVGQGLPSASNLPCGPIGSHNVDVCSFPGCLNASLCFPLLWLASWWKLCFFKGSLIKSGPPRRLSFFAIRRCIHGNLSIVTGSTYSKGHRLYKGVDHFRILPTTLCTYKKKQ